MEVVDALAKLSFSFWQIVVLIAILIFRKELKEIVRRIASVKVAGSEITWGQKSDAVETLTSLKSEIEGSDRSDMNVVDLIDTKIHNRLILALANLKRSTTYLWPALVKVTPGSLVSVPIRQQTLDRIRSELDTLRGSGIVKFEIELDRDNPNGVHDFLIPEVSEDLCRLVAEVERAY
jgi:hypothetical protein